MKTIDSVVGRFPGQELAIHRRCRSDARFRSICEELGEAVDALRRWQSAGPSSASRTQEYGTLVSELETEIATLLRESAESEPR